MSISRPRGTLPTVCLAGGRDGAANEAGGDGATGALVLEEAAGLAAGGAGARGAGAAELLADAGAADDPAAILLPPDPRTSTVGSSSSSLRSNIPRFNASESASDVP